MSIAAKIKQSTVREKNTSLVFGNEKKRSKQVFFQPQLTIGPIDDIYEREADHVANKVMRIGSNEQIQTKISPVSIQRKCAACEEEEHVQRKDDGQLAKEPETPSIISDAINSGGNTLDNGTRSFMENRFGYDFSDVKIHTDSLAAKSAQSINALAYTSGSNIVFNEGQYAPGTQSGKKLLAHELTHVVQQGNGMTANVQRQVALCAPRTVTSATYSRGNDDWAECNYETARITVGLILDPCNCSSGSSPMPLRISYSAILQGKSFTGRTIPNPSGTGTIREQEGQASHIATGRVTPGRSRTGGTQPGMSLSENNLPAGTTNTSGPLTLTMDDSLPGGTPGDPGDIVSQQLSVGSIACGGGSKGGQVNLGGGFQVIDYSISANNTSVLAASITLTEPGRMAGRIPTPLVNIATGTPYPRFPGIPRPGGTGCTCDATTGVQVGSGCSRGTGGAGFGKTGN